MKCLGACFAGYGMGLIMGIGAPPIAGVVGSFMLLGSLLMLYIAFNRKIED